ncbi:MAG TPA: ATP-binding cassette domain-containing protein, partial [Candidatus Binataceae bacterium]
IHRLRQSGLSLIVIEHEAEELRAADRILMLREGAVIAQGPPCAVMTDLQLLEDCGVHPPGLNRVLAWLGIGGHAAGVEQAAEQITRRFPRLLQASAPVPDRRPPVDSKRDGPVLATVESLSFSYPDGAPVLHSVDLKIAQGDFLAIVGQNGSGKTTLAKNIVGLLKPAAGRVTLEGKDLASMRPIESAREVAYVFQNPDHQIFAASVQEEVAFGPRNFGLDSDEIKRRCDEALHAVGLESARDSDPFLLSKGERQRLAVASVLVLRPKILILDEPTTGLDYREQRKMMALVSDLNSTGIAIVIITHPPWLVAEYASRVVLMRRGQKMFDGPVREFFGDETLLRSSSFRPPEVTELSRKFGTLALTPREFVDWVKERT